jgi:hypothetical protein
LRKRARLRVEDIDALVRTHQHRAVGTLGHGRHMLAELPLAIGTARRMQAVLRGQPTS